MKRSLEQLIEQLRLKMYEEYKKDPKGKEALRVSQELDKLIYIAMKSD